MKNRILQHGLIVLLVVILSGCISGNQNDIAEAPLPGSPNLAKLYVPQLEALRWLKTKQNRDGSWGRNPTNQPALTGLAILAFLSYGETPASEEFGVGVEKGMKKIVGYSESIQSNRPFPSLENSYISSEQILTWALAESYGIMRAPVLLPSASNMVHRLIGSEQRPNSLWRESALKAACLAEIPMGVSKGEINEMIMGDRNQTPANDLLATAVRVYGLQLSGSRKKKREQYENLIGYVTTNAHVSWTDHGEEYPLLAWCLCSAVLFRNGGETWHHWYKDNFQELIKNQLVVNSKGCGGFWEVPVSKSGKGQRERDLGVAPF